jgi:hypothetical protein
MPHSGIGQGESIIRVRSVAVCSRCHLLSEIMTHPSEEIPQNAVLDEIPALGVLYPILPPLPPLGSRWMGFSLSILSKQLQSGAIADLEAFGNIFRFWGIGGSEQNSGAGWLYGQLMNIDAPDAFEHSDYSEDSRSKVQQPFAKVSSLPEKDVLGHSNQVSEENFSADFGTGWSDDFSSLTSIVPEPFFTGEPQETDPSALASEPGNSLLSVEQSNEATETIEGQSEPEAIEGLSDQRSAECPLLDQLSEATFVHESRDLELDVSEVGTLDPQDTPTETPSFRNLDEERSTLAQDLDTPAVLQSNNASENLLWNADRQPRSQSGEQTSEAPSAPSDLSQAKRASSENPALATDPTSAPPVVSQQETLSSPSASTSEPQNADALEFQTGQKHLSESSKSIQPNPSEPADRQVGQPLSVDIQNTQGLDDNLSERAEASASQDFSADETSLAPLETPGLSIAEFANAGTPDSLEDRLPRIREETEEALLEGTTNPSAAATSSNPTTELTDSNLSAHNIDPETVDINCTDARNVIAEALDENNEEKGDSETRQEQNEERGEPAIHQDQLPITSELSQTPLSFPTDEQTDSLLTSRNDSSQGSDEFFAEPSEGLNSQDFQGDSATQSERSGFSVNEAEEIAARRSLKYLPENVHSNSNLHETERAISDDSLSIEAEEAERTEALTHELQQPPSSSTLQQPSLEIQVTPTAQENFKTDRTDSGDLESSILGSSVSETQEALESLDEFNIVQEAHSTQSLDSRTVPDSLGDNNALSNQARHLAERQNALDSQSTPNQGSSELRFTDFEAVPLVGIDAAPLSSSPPDSADFIAQDDLFLPDKSIAARESSLTQSSDAKVAPESPQVNDFPQTEHEDPFSTQPISNTDQSEGGLLNWLNRGVRWVKSKFEGAETKQDSSGYREDLSQAASVSQPEAETDAPEGSKTKPQDVRIPIEKEPIDLSPAMDDLENDPQLIRRTSKAGLAEDASFTYPEERSQIFLSPPENVFNRASTGASEQPIQGSATTPSAFRDLGSQASEAIASEVSEDLQAQSDTNQLSNNDDVGIPNSSNILESATTSGSPREQQLENASENPSNPIQEDVVEIDRQARIDPDRSVAVGLEQSNQAALAFLETNGVDTSAPIRRLDTAGSIDVDTLRDEQNAQINHSETTVFVPPENAASSITEPVESLPRKVLQPPDQLSAQGHTETSIDNTTFAQPESHQPQAGLQGESETAWDRPAPAPAKVFQEQNEFRESGIELGQSTPVELSEGSANFLSEHAEQASLIEPSSERSASVEQPYVSIDLGAEEPHSSQLQETDNDVSPIFEGVRAVSTFSEGTEEKSQHNADQFETITDRPKTTESSASAGKVEVQPDKETARLNRVEEAQSILSNTLTPENLAFEGSVVADNLVIEASDNFVQDALDERNPSFEVDDNRVQEGQESAIAPSSARPLTENLSTSDFSTDSSDHVEIEPKQALSIDTFISSELAASSIEEKSILQSVLDESSLNFATEETFDSDIDSTELASEGKSVQSSELGSSQSGSSREEQADFIQSDVSRTSVEGLSQDVSSPDSNAAFPEAVDTGTFLQKEPFSSINQGVEHGTDREKETSHSKPLINSTQSPFTIEEKTILQPIPEESSLNVGTEETLDSDIDIDSAELFLDRERAEHAQNVKLVPTQDEQADLIERTVSRTNVEALSQEISPGSNAVLSDLDREMGSSELSLQPLTEQREITAQAIPNFSPQSNEIHPATDGVSATPEKFSNPEASKSQSDLPSDAGSTHNDTSATPVDTNTFPQENSFSSMSQGVEHNHDQEHETSNASQAEESTSALEDEDLNPNLIVFPSDSPPLHSNGEAGTNAGEDPFTMLDEPQSLSRQSETTAQTLSFDAEQSASEDIPRFELNRPEIEAQTIIQTIAEANDSAVESSVTPLTSTEQISQSSFNPSQPESPDVSSLADIDALKTVQNENADRLEAAQVSAQGQENQAKSILVEKKVDVASKDTHPEVSPELSADQPAVTGSAPETLAQPSFQNEQGAIAFEIAPHLAAQQIETHTAFDNSPEAFNNEEALNPTSLNTAVNKPSTVEPIDSPSQGSDTFILDELSSTVGQKQSLHNEPSSIEEQNFPKDLEPATFILDETSSPEIQASLQSLNTEIESRDEFLGDTSKLSLGSEAFERESAPQQNLLNQDVQNPNQILIGLDEPLLVSSSRDAEASAPAQNEVLLSSLESLPQSPEAFEKAISTSTINIAPSEDFDLPRSSADSDPTVSIEPLVDSEQSVIETPQTIEVARSEIEALTQPQTVADGLSPKIEAELTDFQATQQGQELPSLEGDWTEPAPQESQSHVDLESSASNQNELVDSSESANAQPEIISGLDELPNEMANSTQLEPQPERRTIADDVDIKLNLFTQQFVDENPTTETTDRSSEIPQNDKTLDPSTNLEADTPFVNNISETPNAQIPLESVTFIQDNPAPIVDWGVEQKIVREDATSNASQVEQFASESKEQIQDTKDPNDSPPDNLPFPSGVVDLKIFQGTEQFGGALLNSPSESPLPHQNESKVIASDPTPASEAQTVPIATSSSPFSTDSLSSGEEPQQPSSSINTLSSSTNTFINSNPTLPHLEEQTILQAIPDASSPKATTQEPSHPVIDLSESVQQDWENAESEPVPTQNQQAESIQWESKTNVNAESSSQNLPTGENSTLSESPHRMLDPEPSEQTRLEQSAIVEKTEPSRQTQQIEANPITDEVSEAFTNHNADETQSDIYKVKHLKHNDTLATLGEEPVTLTQDVALASGDQDVEQSPEYRDNTSNVFPVEISTPASEKAEIQTPNSMELEDQTVIQIATANISSTLQATEQHYSAIETPTLKQNELTENVGEYLLPGEINDGHSDINSDHRQFSTQSSTNEIVNEENISSDWAIASSPLVQNSGLLSHLSLSNFLQQNTYDQTNGHQATSGDGIKISDIHLQQENLEENLINPTISSEFNDDLNVEKNSEKSTNSYLGIELPTYWNNLEELVGSDPKSLNGIGLESGLETQEKNNRMPDSWSRLEDLVNSSSKQFNSESRNNVILNEINSEKPHHGWSDLSSLIRSLKSINNNKIPAELLDTNAKVNNTTEENKNDLFSSKEDFSRKPYYLPSRDQFIQLVVNEIQFRNSYDLQFSLPMKALLNDKEALINSQSKYPASLDFSLIQDAYERMCTGLNSDNLTLIITDTVESISKIGRRENKGFSFSRKNFNSDVF